MSKQEVFGYKLDNYLRYFLYNYASYFILVENDCQDVNARIYTRGIVLSWLKVWIASFVKESFATEMLSKEKDHICWAKLGTPTTALSMYNECYWVAFIKNALIFVYYCNFVLF